MQSAPLVFLLGLLGFAVVDAVRVRFDYLSRFVTQ